MLGRSRGPSVRVSLHFFFADGNACQHTQKGCGPEVAIQKCSKNCEEYSNFTGSPSLRWWFHLSTQDPTTWSANIGLRHWQERAEWDKGGESDAQVVNRFPVLLDTASASGQGVACGDVARGICIGVAVVALAPLLGVVVGVAIVAPGIAAGTRVVVAAVEEVVVVVAPLAPATHFPSPKRTPAGIMGCKKPKTALQHRNACDVAFVWLRSRLVRKETLDDGSLEEVPVAALKRCLQIWEGHQV